MDVFDLAYGLTVSEWSKFPLIQHIDYQMMFGGDCQQWVLEEYNSSLPV